MGAVTVYIAKECNKCNQVFNGVRSEDCPFCGSSDTQVHPTNPMGEEEDHESQSSRG